VPPYANQLTIEPVVILQGFLITTHNKRKYP